MNSISSSQKPKKEIIKVKNQIYLIPLHWIFQIKKFTLPKTCSNLPYTQFRVLPHSNLSIFRYITSNPIVCEATHKRKQQNTTYRVSFFLSYLKNFDFSFKELKIWGNFGRVKRWFWGQGEYFIGWVMKMIGKRIRWWVFEGYILQFVGDGLFGVRNIGC